MAFKFCPECGAPTEPRARFCAGCGQAFGAISSTSALPVAGIVSLAVLLLLGGGFWLYFRFAPQPTRPLKPGEGTVADAGAGTRPAAPGGSAPIELPQDIKDYMAGLAKDAADNPKDVQKWKTLAGVYYRASRLDPSYEDKAQEAYDHLIELDEKSLEGLRGLGNIAYDRKDRNGAIAYYEKYLALSPNDPEVRTDLGTMYYESGDSDRAMQEYEKTLATSPTFYQAYFNIAVVHDAKGDRDAAHAALEKARDAATDPNAKQRIGALLDEAKRSGKSLAETAAAMSQTASNAPGGAAGGAPGAAAGAPAAAPAAAASAPADSFEGAVEQLFRSHPIAGPKVVGVQFPESGRIQIQMANFPMDQMPESMRTSYLDKMKGGVQAAEKQFGRTGPVEIELVDQPSGRVMAEVSTPSE